ncbi:MAG: hypothetical protein P1U67_02875 [Alcanivoracaceae bacterium]|nr:hypothetical protein [Alcanivoracaceae bacterium]
MKFKGSIGVILGIAACALSATASAARDWMVFDAEIVDVAMYYDGNYHVKRVRFKSDNIDTRVTCDPTETPDANNIRVASSWTSQPPSSTGMAMYSTLLSAQAQGLTVNLYMDSSLCSNGNYGQQISGVQINSD